jgi:ubiquinone/menaquinone biosynthesis C-methylase UbiE
VYPWRFEKLSATVLDRDYLRVVDHHLEHLIPRVGRYLGPDIQHVLDFGCGSGGSAIALALVYPNVTCTGTDIDPEEVAIARERAKLYGVADRCEFHSTCAGQPLPFQDGSFDFCQCSSVLEYAVDVDVRRFCIHEMARLLRPQGLLFCSVPNRLYPFEIHTRKWGWNHFPKLLHAHTVDCTAWEVKRLALPWVLRLYRTPWIELFRPWSSFCLQRETGILTAAKTSATGSSRTVLGPEKRFINMLILEEFLRQ